MCAVRLRDVPSLFLFGGAQHCATSVYSVTHNEILRISRGLDNDVSLFRINDPSWLPKDFTNICSEATPFNVKNGRLLSSILIISLLLITCRVILAFNSSRCEITCKSCADVSLSEKLAENRSLSRHKTIVTVLRNLFEIDPWMYIRAARRLGKY